MSVYRRGNLRKILSANSYPGRGIVVGVTPDGGSAVAAYFIMGRSVNSRNRIFVLEDGILRTHPFDPSKLSDPSLVIYNAVRAFGDNLIVTNGDQTDTVYDFLRRGETFETALETREFEPDGPNFTPRISALLSFGGGFSYKMNILKSADAEGSACDRYNFAYNPIAGEGRFLHTYDGDGSPIPSFSGEPERVGITDGIDAFAEEVWSALDADNKVALYVRFTDLKSGAATHRIYNKNE